MKKRLGVIGVGSAGVLSLTHLCTWLDNGWDVVSIYDPDKPILGIGESTNGGFVALLERGLHFFLGNDSDLAALDATLKFGSYFEGWRAKSWVNPLLDGNTAIHFNNFKFKEFAFGRLAQLWPEKFKTLEGNVTEVLNRENGVSVTVNGVEEHFDYVLDCMGFPQTFDGYTMSGCTPVNRCEIYNIPLGQFTNKPYTDHIAMKHGWMFGIPLQSRKGCGYMYNDKISSQDDVRQELKEYFGVSELDNKEYRFQCYSANEMVSGRVGKNGNKALFFEPLIANSIFQYIYIVRLFYDFVMGHAKAHDCNAAFRRAVGEMEDVITYYYQGGSTHDTPFWRYAQQYSRERMRARPEFQQTMRTYAELRRQGILHHGPTSTFVPLTWEIVDEALGYGYINPATQTVDISADVMAPA